MTRDQIELVQQTWRAVLPVGDTAAEFFYGKLLSLDPSMQELFHDDAKERGRNLAAMISVVVGSLSRPERILLAVRQLGQRHAAYGVKPRHYELGRIALLWMPGTGAGRGLHAGRAHGMGQRVRPLRDYDAGRRVFPA